MASFLEIMLSNAASAAVLAVVVGGIALFCRRPAVRHALWLLVLFKFITPSLVPFAIPWPHADEASLLERSEPNIPSAMNTATVPGEVAVTSETWIVVLPEEPAPATPAPSGWPETLAGAWLTGTIAWFAWAGFSIVRFHRLLRRARRACAQVKLAASFVSPLPLYRACCG